MNSITIYTDGSTKTNPGIGAWGTIVIEETDLIRDEKIHTKCYRKTTNNRMELLGVIEPLEDIVSKPGFEDKTIEVVSDSQYVVNSANQWIENWKKNKWRTASGKKVINKDLILRLDSLILIAHPKFTWVKGHNGNPYNERCDKLAKGATESDTKHIDSGYEETITLW